MYRVLRGFWDWTRFFATKQLRVAGSLDAGRLSCPEIRANDIYATKFTLLDGEGRPAEIFIQDGELKVNYDFHDVFVYPVDGINMLKYVYRYPKTIENFTGLTPYETYINFIPYESNETCRLDGKDCPRLCSANGKEIPVLPTPMLITCPTMKKIVRLQIVDEDGKAVKSIEIPERDDPTRLLTLNMPSFREAGTEIVHRVQLPSSGSIDAYTRNSVVPPYLRPAFPCGCHHPPRPHLLPDDLFNDNPIPPDDSLFDDDFDPNDGWIDFDTTGRQFEEIYENYVTDTYSNMTLFKSDFETNKRQFLVVVVEDAH